MNAIILAGGFGTRLDSISNGLPKSLMPIGNGVFLDVLIKKILSQNINKIFLSVHYKSKLFFEYLEQCEFSQYIEIVEEETILAVSNVNVIRREPSYIRNGRRIRRRKSGICVIL